VAHQIDYDDDYDNDNDNESLDSSASISPSEHFCGMFLARLSPDINHSAPVGSRRPRAPHVRRHGWEVSTK
jgi:hypothetical protein